MIGKDFSEQELIGLQHQIAPAQRALNSGAEFKKLCVRHAEKGHWDQIGLQYQDIDASFWGDFYLLSVFGDARLMFKLTRQDGEFIGVWTAARVGRDAKLEQSLELIHQFSVDIYGRLRFHPAGNYVGEVQGEALESHGSASRVGRTVVASLLDSLPNE